MASAQVDMNLKVETTGFQPVPLEAERVEEIRADIDRTVSEDGSEPPPFRIAPDVTFALPEPDGSERIYQLLAGGAVLKDPLRNRVWQFEQGTELLQSLVPSLLVR